MLPIRAQNKMTTIFMVPPLSNPYDMLSVIYLFGVEYQDMFFLLNSRIVPTRYIYRKFQTFISVVCLCFRNIETKSQFWLWIVFVTCSSWNTHTTIVYLLSWLSMDMSNSKSIAYVITVDFSWLRPVYEIPCSTILTE